MTPARFPHSDTPGSTLGCQLPRAYRRLLRPSSALDAKASTMCPSQLVTHTTNPHHPPTGGRTRQAMHTTRHKRTTHPTPQSQGQVRKKQKETHHTHTQNNRVRPGASPDARVHYPDLKQQPHTTHRRPTAPTAQQGGAEAQPSLTGRSDPSEPQQCVADETAWSFHIPKQHQSHHTNPADTAPAGGGELSVRAP